MSHKVSLIIVNWNGRHLLKDCLFGLSHQTYKDFETIVVDNGSSDDSIQYVRKKFPGVKVVPLTENRGFTGGNLAGLEAASGEYIALLNNDTFPDNRWLSRLMEAMEQHPDVGMCASRLMIWDSDFIDAAGDDYLTAGIGQKRGHGQTCEQYRKPMYTFGACAGAVLYRNAMLNEVGFFDNDFLMVNEDTDLSFRAQLMGWKCLYVPEAVVRHKVSVSRKERKDLMVYYKVRNSDFVLIKNMPTPLLLRYLHHVLLGQIAYVAKFALVQGYWKAVFKAKIDVFRSLHSLLEKRRRIQKEKLVSDEYLRSVLRSTFDQEVLQTNLFRTKKGS